MAETRNTAPQMTFEDYLRQHGHRCTQERIAVIRTAASIGGLFTADDLHRSLHAKGYPLSVATVYNTLRILSDASLLLSHSFGSRTVYYEIVKPGPASASRILLICGSCGKVREARDPELSRMLRARRFSTFSTSSCALYVHGTCGRCRRKKKTSKSNT